MEKFYREQPKNEDVRFVTIAEQKGEDAKWRGYEGGVAAVNELPVDSMEGLQVSTVIPGGYYADAVKEDAPSQDGTDEPVEGEIENPTEEEGEF